MTKRLLELFCGTKSVGNVFEEDGYEVVSLDYNKKFNATHTEDILQWDYKKYPADYFDVIWASPDCRTWSLASGGKYRNKNNIYGLDNQFKEGAILGNQMIMKVMEILNYFSVTAFFIENPRGMLNLFPPFQEWCVFKGVHKTLVYYGNYDDWGCPKPTHIWSNLPLWKSEKCPELSADKYIVKNHPLTKRPKKYYHTFWKGSAETRSKIPPSLIKRLKGLVKG